MDTIDKIVRVVYGATAIVVFALTINPVVGWMAQFVPYERRVRPLLRETEWGLHILFFVFFACLAILGWALTEKFVNKIRTP